MGVARDFCGHISSRVAEEKIAPTPQATTQKRTTIDLLVRLIPIALKDPLQPGVAGIENCKCRCCVRPANAAGARSRRPYRSPPAQNFPASKSCSVGRYFRARPARHRTRHMGMRDGEFLNRNKIPSHRSNVSRVHFRFVGPPRRAASPQRGRNHRAAHCARAAPGNRAQKARGADGGNASAHTSH